MMNEVNGLIKKVETGEIQGGQVAQATDRHVQQMNASAVAEHANTAAQNMQNSGQTDLAAELRDLITRTAENPQGLKTAISSFLQKHPQAIQHFAPDFAQGILKQISL